MQKAVAFFGLDVEKMPTGGSSALNSLTIQLLENENEYMGKPRMTIQNHTFGLFILMILGLD